METAGGKVLARHLGLGSVVAISVGAMMGSGIFVLPLLAAELAGPWVAVSYVVAALMVVPAMLSKAELATAMPVSGGTFVYLDRSMGPWVGTIGGMGTWLALSAKTAFALVGLGAYLVLFSSLNASVFALSVLGLLVLINIVGAGKASLLQKIVVVASAVALLGFAAWGGFTAQLAHFTPALPHGPEGILAGAGFVFVSYNGVTKVCSLAEEIKDPDRNIPLGMALSLGLVTALYAIIALVVVANVDLAHVHHDQTPIATAAGAIGGPTFKVVMAVIAIIGLISMCNAGVLATARYPFAMGRDGLMPATFARVAPRLGTPARAILLTAAVLVVLVLGLPVYELAKLASGFTIFIFAAVNLAVIVLRESRPGWYTPSFTSPLYPWAQLAGILGCIVVLWNLGWLPFLGIIGAVIVGTIWYFAYARRRTDRRSVLDHLFDSGALPDATPERERHARVLVPLFGQARPTGPLIHMAGAFAETGVVDVVRMESAAEGLALGDVVDKDEHMQQLAHETATLAADLHLQVEFRDVVSHNTRRALLDEALRTQARWMLLDWPDRDAGWLVRRPLAWWLDHAPCNLAVFSDRTDRTAPQDEDPSDPLTFVSRNLDEILVLAVPGPDDSLLVHVADNLAVRTHGEITLMMVVPTGTSPERMQAHRDYHDQLGERCASPVRSRIVPADDMRRAIIEAAADYELLIMGAPSERGVAGMFTATKHNHIVDRVPCSVLWLKTPRRDVHPTSPVADAAELAAALEFAVLVSVEAGRVRDLLADVARRISADPALVRLAQEALADRERRQSTSLGNGLALSAPLVSGLPGVRVVVARLAEPVSFSDSGKATVDIFIVVAAPPNERNLQLRLVTALRDRLEDEAVLSRLRQADDGEGEALVGLVE